MYNKFCRLAGALCLYIWLAHYFKTHYIVAGILVFSLFIFVIFIPNRKRIKQDKLNTQMIKKFAHMKNNELVAYRIHLTGIQRNNDTEIYDKECMRRFGFIERKII